MNYTVICTQTMLSSQILIEICLTSLPLLVIELQDELYSDMYTDNAVFSDSNRDLLDFSALVRVSCQENRIFDTYKY